MEASGWCTTTVDADYSVNKTNASENSIPPPLDGNVGFCSFDCGEKSRERYDAGGSHVMHESALRITSKNRTCSKTMEVCEE